MDSAYQFVDSTNPFPYKDSISFTNLASNKTNQTFIGIKLGDVNYDWNASVAKGITIDNLELIVDNVTKLSTGNYQLGIKTKNFKDLLSLQYTLHFDNTKYEFVGIKNNKLGIEFNSKQANETGNISMLWADAKGVERSLEDGSDLFELVLKPKVWIKNLELCMAKEILNINASICNIEALDKHFNQHNIILINQSTKQQEVQNNKEWFSVSPNPTTGIIQLLMGFNKNKIVTLQLIDASGKLILQKPLEVEKGSKIFTLNLEQNNQLPAGIYFLKINGLEGEDVKRIVVE